MRYAAAGVPNRGRTSACRKRARSESYPGITSVHAKSPKAPTKGEKCMAQLMGFVGLVTIMGMAFAFSTNRRAIRIKTILWGMGLQFAFALMVLRLEAGRDVLRIAGDAVNRLLSYSFAGSEFVFGELGKSGGKIGM